MRFLQRIRVLVLVAVCCAPGAAAALTCDRAAQTVIDQAKDAFSGSRAAVLARAEGRPLVAVAFGPSIDSRTRFLVGSVSKPLAAAIALRLVARGVISLDEPVWSFLPPAFRDGLPADWRRITVRNLLNHTSGIEDYLDVQDARLAQPAAFDEILRLAGSRLRFPPLSRLRYSSTNYYLLAKIMSAAAQLPYPDLLLTELASPLGLADTGAAYSSDGLIGSTGIALENLEGAGNAYSSAEDLMAFLEALDGTALLSRAAVEGLMWTPDPACAGPDCDRYGMGFSLRAGLGGSRLAWVLHEGHLRGVSSAISKVPSKKLNLVLLSDGQNLPLEEVSRRMLSVLSDCVDP